MMRNGPYSLFLHIALIVLALITMGLAKQKRDLLAQLAPSTPPQLEIGTAVIPAEFQTLAGTHDTLQWSGAGQDRLLFIFTTGCPACTQNQDAWRALHRRVDAHVEVLGISLDNIETTEAYRIAHALPFDVIVANRESFAASYQIQSVPTTLHVASNGRVEGVWTGTLTTKRQTAIASSVLRRSRTQ